MKEYVVTLQNTQTMTVKIDACNATEAANRAADWLAAGNGADLIDFGTYEAVNVEESDGQIEGESND